MTKVRISHIKMIPSSNKGFLRGTRVSEYDIKTVSPSEFGTQKIDEKWLEKQADFMMKLDDHDLFTIISFTTRSHQWVVPFMRSGKLPGKKELKNIVQDGLVTPLYPQFLVLVSRKVAVFGKKSLDTEMFQDQEHRTYVRNLFLDEKTPEDTRYLAFQMLLRGNDFSERALRMALNLYVKDMKRLTNRCPRTTTEMTVFRGQLENFVPKNAKVWNVKEFLSTTFSLSYALAYSTNDTNRTKGRIIRLFVPKGSPCLALCIVNPFDDVGEFEILLPPSTFDVVAMGVERTVGDRDLPTNTLQMKKRK